MKKLIVTALLVFSMTFPASCQFPGSSGSEDSSGNSSGNDPAEQEQTFDDAQREEGSQGYDQPAGISGEDRAVSSSEDFVADLSPSETLELQYQFINTGQYEKAYALFAKQSQGILSLEEYSSFFNSNYEVSEYTFNSEQINGDTATVRADLVVISTEQEIVEFPITQEFTLVNGQWRVIMRDNQIEAIAGSGEDDSEGADLDRAVGDYYRAAGAEEWAYTYDHLDSRTQSMFTEEEWASKNQWFWNRNPTVYHILSINLDSASEEFLAEVEVRITGEGGSAWVRTTYFVFEDGEWKHRFSDEEDDLFMSDATYEEFVEAQAGDSPDSQSQGGSTYQPPGFEQFVGEWYRHGEALTIDSDRTGSGVSRIYSTPSGEVCPPDRSKCNVKFELSFTPTNNGIDAEVTSTEDGEYSDLAVGDTYSLKLVGDNLLRQSNRDEVGGYWCNSQTSEANYECGA